MEPLKTWLKGTTPEIERVADIELGETKDVRQTSLKEFKELVKEVPGFRPCMDDEFLVRFLRAKKYDVNRAFNTFKNYYSFKSRYSGTITDLLPRDLKSIFETSKIFVSPKRGPSGEGILIVIIGTYDIESFSVEKLLASAILSAEIGLETEGSQVCGNRIVVDMQGMTFGKIRYFFNPTLIGVIAKCIQDVMPCRIKGIHSVNEPVYFGATYQVIKHLLTKKLRERIHFHSSDLSSLHKILPPETLPEELGGYLDKKDFQNFQSLVQNNNDLIERIHSYTYNGTKSPHQRNRDKTKGDSSEDRETTRTLFNVSFA